MTIYKFIESDTSLTKEDLNWYSRVNGGTANGAVLRVTSDDGQTITEKIVFKRGTGKRQFFGSVTDWDKESIVLATYERFLRIRKSDGAVIDGDFDL